MILGQGAEAKVEKSGDSVIKHRIEKSYRHSDLDLSIRKFRTKREAKVLQKLESLNFPAPRLINSDKLQKIEMSFIQGPMLKEVLHTNHIEFASEIGKKIATLHKNDIIHGDLTTSNMIHKDEIHFIDFGLSSFSIKAEDKAVDLHLFKRALESKHHEIFESCFAEALKAYQANYENAKDILERLKQVELRGKNKKKGRV